MKIHDFYNMKDNDQKITMITCYDYTSAKIIEKSNIDCILVGDSASMVMHGFDSTLPISTDTLALHVASVKRGAPSKFIIGDLPFLSYRKDLKSNMEAVELLMKAGANAIKLEGITGNEQLISHLVNSGVPVMAHLGLTPQFTHQLGGFKVQGKSEKAKKILLEQSKAAEQSGAFSLVLEAVPVDIAEKITETLHIPTIGIGAGPFTDGQVLVMQDMLGLDNSFKPKFLKKYLNGEELFLKAFNEFDSEVKKVQFPTMNESYK